MKSFACILALLLFASPALALEDGLYRDQAPGYGGNVIVTVKIRSGRILEITTDSTAGDKSEYYLKAESALIPAILEKQGLDGVDAVAGATGTSQSILEAMRGILEQANYTGAPLGMVNNAAQNALDGAKDAADDVMDGAENIARETKDEMQNAADKTIDGVKNALGD